MVSRSQNIEFAKVVARKKPAIKDAIDNMEQYTVGQINELPIPGWVKKVIITEKELSEKRKGCLTPDEIAERMMSATENNETSLFEYGVYQGPSVDFGKRLLCTIEPGETILFCGNDSIKINYTVVKGDSKSLAVIRSNTTIAGEISISNYIAMLNKRV